MLIRKRRLKNTVGLLEAMGKTCMIKYGKSKGRKKKPGNPESLRCQ